MTYIKTYLLVMNTLWCNNALFHQELGHNCLPSVCFSFWSFRECFPLCSFSSCCKLLSGCCHFDVTDSPFTCITPYFNKQWAECEAHIPLSGDLKCQISVATNIRLNIFGFQWILGSTLNSSASFEEI